MGGTDVKHLAATLALFPAAKVLRIFDTGLPATVDGNPQLAAAVSYVRAHGGEVWYSFNSDPGVRWPSIVKNWADSGARIRWTYFHEADLPSNHLNPTTFVSTFTSLIARAAAVSGPRVSPQSIFTAFMLQPPFRHGSPDSWYVPSAPVLGFDCYSPSNLPLVIAYAKAKGKPYTIPEMGAGGPTSSSPGDAGAVAFLQQMVDGWRQDPPLGAAWFNKTGQSGKSVGLAILPQALAYLNKAASGLVAG